MNHGARGIVPESVGPGDYRAQAMMLPMEGTWLLGIRVERTGRPVDSTVAIVQVPRDNSSAAVPPMYLRPTGSTQIEDIAVYTDGVTPDTVTVKAGRPVRLELMYVDTPDCGHSVEFGE